MVADKKSAEIFCSLHKQYICDNMQERQERDEKQRDSEIEKGLVCSVSPTESSLSSRPCYIVDVIKYSESLVGVQQKTTKHRSKK